MNNQEIISKIKTAAAVLNENLTTEQLVQKALERNEGILTNTGALAADTGEFTGRSPKDKFTVKDTKTENTVWWGTVNQPFDENKFNLLRDKVVAHLYPPCLCLCRSRIPSEYPGGYRRCLPEFVCKTFVPKAYR